MNHGSETSGETAEGDVGHEEVSIEDLGLESFQCSNWIRNCS